MKQFVERLRRGASTLRAGRDGQAAVLGLALVVGIVVLGTLVVALAASPALSDAGARADGARAEHALGALDSRATAAALGADSAQRRQVDFGTSSRGGQIGTTQGSWMRVALVNATTGAPRPVTNASLGSVVYAHEGSTVALEGGGIWRSERQGSSMVSPPELHYSQRPNGTLTLPIISVSGTPHLSGTVAVEQAGPTRRAFPNATADLTNRLNDTKVRITVHSRYYRAWGRYFDRSTGAAVTYDHARETVSATFLALPPWFSPRSGIVATAGSGELSLAGKGAYTDSYNSTLGDYEATSGSNGDVVAVGDVTTIGSSAVNGDVFSGSTVDLSGTTDIYGDVHWTESYEQDGAAVAGDDTQIDGVATVEPIDGYVYERVADIRESNDNANTSLITNDEVALSTGERGTLGAGSYYLDHLTLDGSTLTLDTTDGDITIAVRDYVRVDQQGAQKTGLLNVTGPNDVTVIVAGRHDYQNLNLYVAGKSKVDVPHQRSTQLTFYGTQSFNASIVGSQDPNNVVSIDAVIYAPAGYDGSGYVYLKQAELYGGAVTGDLTIGQYAAVHYDRALRTHRYPRSPTLARLEFMHVSVRPIEVSDESSE